MVLPPLRHAGMARAYELVVLEDENTDYQTLGPVSKMFNLIVRAIVDGPDSDAYKQHKIKRQRGYDDVWNEWESTLGSWVHHTGIGGDRVGR